MTDRELLEAAAKAAGIVLNVWDSKNLAFFTPGQFLWNPLTDDGDALRLAVKLCIEICSYRPIPEIGFQHFGTIAQDGEPPNVRVDESGPNVMVNARRAIVRAAAAMAGA